MGFSSVMNLCIYAITVSAASLPMDSMVQKAVKAFEAHFPFHLYGEFLDEFSTAMKHYKNSTAYTGYDSIINQPRCPMGFLSQEAHEALQTAKAAPFPGGSGAASGMNLVADTVAQLQKANGPAAAQVPGIGLLAATALKQMKGVVQTAVAIAATDVPPTIPPPVWNNMPFVCMPMVTGSNCFGAVLYPITIGDFVLADVTDQALDGVIASFPAYYRAHVGATDDASYQRCFNANMGMQCANAFPTCTTIQAREDTIPNVGRGPMCFLHCIQTLIACPGMWVDDLEDICQNVSVPPFCSFAVYQKSAPPQLSTHDEAQGFPLNCPSSSAGQAEGSLLPAPQVSI